MKVSVTVYKDNNGVYTDGVPMELDSLNFAIRGQGYISTVDPFDFKPDLSRPHIYATEIDTNDGRKFYVSQTPEEIEAQIATTGNGDGNVQFIVQFIVGEPGAPANMDTEYVNADVVEGAGEEILIEKDGTGYLTEGTNYNLLVGGGFELLGGSVFSTGEKYTISKVTN